MNKNLLHKYFSGNVSEEERIEIMHWIDESDENKQTYFQLRKIYDISYMNPVESDSIVSNKSKYKEFRYYFTRVAAVAAIFIFLFWGIKTTLHDTIVLPVAVTEGITAMQSIEVPVGQHVKVTLADGTVVHLNSNSKFKFPATFGSEKRQVFLDGEGYFEVAHNEKIPFVVGTDECEVKVLGTTFNLRAYSQSDIFETSLLEGNVLLTDLSTKNTLNLNPGQKAILKNNKFDVFAFSSEDEFMWKNGILVFDNEPFTSVFQRLEEYYQIDIKIDTKKINNYRCTGKFKIISGVNNIMRILKKSNDFNYEIDEEKNSIRVF